MLARAATLTLALLAASCGNGRAPVPERPLLVFAAASLKGPLDEVGAAFTREAGTTVTLSFAASSALARQIESGAPADVLISADEEWMDYLAARNLVRADTRRVVIGNRLVLIAPAGLPGPLALRPGLDLAPALGTHGRLALADPAAVPAGRYARAALEWLGAWPALEQRLAPAENVRAALLLVALGEAPLGVVYASDAAAEPRVAVLGTFPREAHVPIRYPAAVVTRSRHAAATRFVAALGDGTARAAFLRHGFTATE
jgi:molybdate transport system substrate-binding protein